MTKRSHGQRMSELQTSTTPQRASATPMKNMSEYFTQALSPIKENFEHENVQHDSSYSKEGGNGDGESERFVLQVSTTTDDENGETEDASMSIEYPELERNVLPSSENSYSSILVDMNTLEEGNTVKGQSETEDISRSPVEDSQITIYLNASNKTDHDETITNEHEDNTPDMNVTLKFPSAEDTSKKDTEKSIHSGEDNENVTSTTQLGMDGQTHGTVNSDTHTETKADAGRNEVTSTSRSINYEESELPNTRRLGICGPQKKLQLKIKLEKFDNNPQADLDKNSSIQISTDGENEQPKITLYCCNKCPKKFYMMTGYETHLFQNHSIRNVEEYPATVMYKKLDSPSSRSSGKETTESEDNTHTEDQNKGQNNHDEDNSAELFTAFDGNDEDKIDNENFEEGQLPGKSNPDLDKHDIDDMNENQKTGNSEHVWQFIPENWGQRSTDQRILHTGNEPEEREYKCSECPEAFFFYESGLRHHFQSHKRQMEMDSTLYEGIKNKFGNDGEKPDCPNLRSKNSLSTNSKKKAKEDITKGSQIDKKVSQETQRQTNKQFC